MFFVEKSSKGTLTNQNTLIADFYRNRIVTSKSPPSGRALHPAGNPAATRRSAASPRGPRPDQHGPGDAGHLRLRAWLNAAAISEGTVFRSVDRHGHPGGGLSDRGISEVVKRRAAAAGMDSTRFSGHSLRAGFATEAAAAGVPEADIARPADTPQVARHPARLCPGRKRHGPQPERAPRPLTHPERIRCFNAMNEDMPHRD